MKRWGKWLVALLLVVVLAGWGLDRLYPLPAPAAPATRVLAADGQLLRAFPAPDETWRYGVRLDQVAPVYLEVLLAYEDRAFYYHPGINPLALLRASWQNLIAGEVVSGGSTLSMQVAGMLDPYPRTLKGKVRQALRTLQLEWYYSKAEILQLYLNQAPFGGMLSGVESASRHYFGKPATELSDAEAALLAVLPQRPSDWRPDRYPQRAQRARDKVLRRMAELGIWPQTRVDAALQEPVAALPPQQPLLAPLLSRRLRAQCPDCTTIQTLIDADLQRQVQALVATYRSRLDAQQSLAVMVVRNEDMAVQAYVGSAQFGSMQRQGHVDMVQAIRSPGSTLKPFAYAMALDQGLIHSHSMLLDTPRYGLRYRPHNFTGGFSGPVTVADALQRSLNLPVVQLVDHLGPERFVAGLQNAGLDLQGPGVQSPSSAVVLGAVGTRLDSLVGTYTALGRGGLAGTPRLTPDNMQSERWAMSPGAAWITWRLLAQSPWRALGQVGASEWRLAWKTGTSYGYRDTWAIGVTPGWTLGVWVGRPDGSPSPGQHGRSLAAPLLFRIHELLPETRSQPVRPDSVSVESICWPLGSRAAHPDNQLGNCHRQFSAWLLNGTAPLTLPQAPGLALQTLVRRTWIDTESGLAGLPLCAENPQSLQQRLVALWPQQAEPWLKPAWKRQSRLPDTMPGCEGEVPKIEAVQIVGIEEGSRLQLLAGRPLLQVDLHLAGAQGQVNWYLNGKPLAGAQKSHHALELHQPGQYRVSAVDEAGNTDSIRFSFRRFGS